MPDTPEQLPPQDLHAEQATLGGCLVEPGAATRALAAVSPDCFYREAHQHIFSAITAVHERSEPVDLVTVSGELRNAGKFDTIGGGAYLAAVIREAPTAAHVVAYAKIVGQKAALRRLISASSDVRDIAYSDPADVDDALHRAEALVFDVRRSWDGEYVANGGSAAELAHRHGGPLLERWAVPQGVSGPRLGIASLDEGLLCGLPTPGLVVIRAETSYGKTALACQCALATAMYGMPVMYFDLETTDAFVMGKWIQQMTGVDAHWRKKTAATPDQLGGAADALDRFGKLPIRAEAPGQIDFPTLRARITDIHREQARALYVIDFLQKVRLPERKSSWEALAALVNGLQTLARELETTVLMGSQVTRTDWGDYKTRGARDIEHSADVVLTIRKRLPKRKADTDARDVGQVERASPLAFIVVDKHRQGSVGSEAVHWDASWQRFFGLREAGRDIANIDEYRRDYDNEQWREIEAGKAESEPAPWVGRQ